jgi:large subunit ribosomal protein L21
MASKKSKQSSRSMIVEQGGFQYSVSEGDTISVPSIEAAEGAEITIGKVLLVRDGESVTIGTPDVKGASVTAKIVAHGKYPKILVIKKKRRKNYKRKNGHRQPFTKIQITALSVK